LGKCKFRKRLGRNVRGKQTFNKRRKHPFPRRLLKEPRKKRKNGP